MKEQPPESKTSNARHLAEQIVNVRATVKRTELWGMLSLKDRDEWEAIAQKLIDDGVITLIPTATPRQSGRLDWGDEDSVRAAAERLEEQVTQQDREARGLTNDDEQESN